MKLLLFSFLSIGILHAQSFYVLSGVDAYDTIVINTSPKTKKYTKDIKALMLGMSKEIGVSTSGHSSRVLVFIIKAFSLGDTLGLRVDLQLGEFVLRDKEKQKVFALTYESTTLLAVDFKDEEDVEEQLADSVEEMLEKFKLQYKEDNKQVSQARKTVSHETFASTMGYETNYEIALKRAKKEKKSLLIFMTTSYCPWCRKLENRILSQNEIDAKITSKYIPLMLNLDKNTYPKQFAKTRFTPILYIVNSKDETISHKFVGYSSRGEFLHILKKE
jgi:thiol-disulfide isomerase/thioredoxin